MSHGQVRRVWGNATVGVGVVVGFQVWVMVGWVSVGSLARGVRRHIHEA
ncbi:hypothetical protein Caci_5023 [Catenulispora acidiphila DSM 44928]|uniref:Uncharacterized protein n=1 Tax=Catenulispora acidiphila (strain DSM 44928 / JCM 14897 / NBRC 102108 / NRRL B-24433 / ID139908) TaxID=479433 RepID=C7Q4T5_CATAD|nr:hypothetical protein [Catenulispora acidiphila]ACU73883.1 hypothetical protein Caci_5023 [Catenulispora acidiphila DSM 44928]